MQFQQNELNFDKWWDTYHPIKNPMDSTSGAFDGCMFETFGSEYQQVVQTHETKPSNIWTLLDCDGEMYISSGWHYVNRMGYFITEVAFSEDLEFIV
jgi:hypothetical protein